MKPTLLAICLVAPCWGQFALSVVSGDAERPVAAAFDLGAAAPTETLTARFRVRNTSDASAPLSPIDVLGTGFAIDGAPPLPAAVAPGQAVEFRVTFQAATVATYSATLEAGGVSTLLTAAVASRLTYATGGAAIDFGPVEAGASATRRIAIRNLTGDPLPLPAVTAAGDAFSIANVPAVGTIIDPGAESGFDIVFRPPGAGTWTGSLTIEDRVYALTGAATGIPLPKPALSISLPEPHSGQDGSLNVSFDAPSRTAGAGTLTLDFTPLAKGAADPAIQLGIIGRSLPFTIAAGDTGLRPVNFQTGTTAGVIGITVELGGAKDRKTVEIPAAPVAIASAQGIRSAGSIELRIAGFDNTRTAGPITFTFFDSAGNALPSIPVDYTADFAAWFAASDQGGRFLLRSVFPVTGDVSQIAEFAVQMTNAAGSAATGRVRF